MRSRPPESTTRQHAAYESTTAALTVNRTPALRPPRCRLRGSGHLGGARAPRGVQRLPGHLQPAHGPLHREAAAEAPGLQGSAPPLNVADAARVCVCVFGWRVLTCCSLRPVQHRNNILYLVESFQTVIIVGETGCGKTTQLPQVVGPF